ncbi:hypothetical protein Kpol_348p2 [Vanderwaltozyma polyspora DSM 70294]|uniref:Uncharacterized protein n=1 Tax=Vanderwaltozyma polyspora (strain ATCC 22028 / DSM 70294 / BCRC 21397 / CBS 2163 / NBRC 10782 / NRRL Y-8283 / UCD 57-17) TaxID=436907 RepID=A7TS48_VANPO|nr:uncharacterized protein Kpol_348p2 [Vanderwaltozyma polyspora DSM 70294]EDO14898.1 hypothetical protein Kpol_348p2 [Vanderwaltozyma polyspora DSM 70294]
MIHIGRLAFLSTRKVIFCLAISTIFMIVSLLHLQGNYVIDSGFSFKDLTNFNNTLSNTVEKIKIYGDDSAKGNDILLSLVRNSELVGMLETVKQFEKRFNSKYHYDWYFMNDEDFDDVFIEVISEAVSGNAKFIKIPNEFWSYPEGIDQDRASTVREKSQQEHINYGGSESYRFMCRFNSGFFYKLEELKDIDYYWRIEPNVDFSCDIPYDVFQYMRNHNKKYAFNMALTEDERTIPTLWNATTDFFVENPKYIAKNNNLKFISDDNGKTYNLCHFWSNFEIASLDFYRGEKYNAYFDYLESKGGFFYERWGDAPVHTLAVSYMLSADEIFFVGNTGYFHHPNKDCPSDVVIRQKLHCNCNPGKDFTWHRWSCASKFFDVNNFVKPNTMTNIKYNYEEIYRSMLDNFQPPSKKSQLSAPGTSITSNN